NYRVGGKIQLDLTPIEGLTFTAIASPQFTSYKEKDHKKKYEVYRITGDLTSGSGYSSTNLSEKRNDTYSLTMQFFANYKLQVKRHSIGLMAGYEDYTYKWENLGASRTNYSLDNFPYLDLGPQDYQYNNGSAGHNAYRSIFGRIMYSWADRYMLQANIRSDGSSRFADGHRWGTFPSVSAGWIISEEDWFNKSVINYIKLRGSIGQLGNERIGSEFPYQAKLSFGTGFIPNASTGVSDVVQTAYQTDYAFKNITWETTTTYGVGADITLLSNRLSTSVDYYYKKTTDMLMEVGFPSYFGYNAPQNNAADMHTKGWDFELAWRDQINDFRYGVSFNISDYRSRMGYMADRQNIDGAKITEEGSYFNEWYGYKNLGIILNEAAMLDKDGNKIAVLTNNDKAGNIRYQDIDGDGKITASNDRVRLGNSLPELQYGGSLWAEWKNFDFNLSFQGIGHQLVYWSWPGTPFNYQAYASPLNLIESHWSPTATDAENAKAKYPKLTTNNTNIYAKSDFYLFNGAYMRIKNITLGYTIPSDITKKFLVNNLRVYFSANDLPAFSKYPSGYDPEWNRSSDLIMSSYIFGLNVSF
ncbi:SusC/RagA family TonB-linked outer membrane protein, partial [Massilibacteroides sp.]|uniref:SusC/RagA family TonB-linked outer membrane protein n=1 Tax=Massilibacteroides sp. TaxID=2034766 RepID=UPI002607CDDA